MRDGGSQAPPATSELPNASLLWALTGFIAATGTLLLLGFVIHLDPPLAPFTIHWAVIALMYAGAQLAMVHLPFGKQFHSFYMTEIPLVIGLFFVEPEVLVPAAALGTASGLVVRGQRGLKLAFNASMALTEVGAASLIFHAITSGSPAGLRDSLATFGATLAVAGITHVAITVAITLSGEPRAIADLVRSTGLGFFVSTGTTSLGLVAVSLLLQDRTGAFLLIVPAAVLFTVFKSLIKRLATEDALARERARFTAMVANSSDIVSIIDEQGFVSYMSPAITSALGLAADEVEGAPAYPYVHPGDVAGMRGALEDVKRSRDGQATFQFRARHEDGSWRWLEMTMRNALANPDVAGVVVNQRDVTERMKTHEEMERNRTQLQSILDHTPAIIFVRDMNGRYVLVNKQYERILSRRSRDILGKSDFELLDPMIARNVRNHDLKVLRENEASSMEEQVLDRQGRPRSYLSVKFPLRDASGTPYAICGIATDMTDQKRFEEGLRQTQKLEAVGQLAGGIAHDFNNLLSVIGSYADFVAEAVADRPGALADVQAIRTASDRAADLTRQLLTFSRRTVADPQLLDLNTSVSEVCRLLGRTIRESVELVTELDTAVPPVRMDPGQIEQILMNLALNARDAMPSGGKITIRTLARAAGSSLKDPTIDGCAVLQVEDTGHGIEPHVKERIFEPFFTTKTRDSGTGLGLATVYGIVESLGGSISVDSTPGRGSIFSVFLPAAATDPPPAKAQKPRIETGRKGTILVVEDEVVVGRLVSRILSEKGHQVLLATSAAEALDMMEGLDGEVDVLLTDVIMPPTCRGRSCRAHYVSTRSTCRDTPTASSGPRRRDREGQPAVQAVHRKRALDKGRSGAGLTPVGHAPRPSTAAEAIWTPAVTKGEYTRSAPALRRRSSELFSAARATILKDGFNDLATIVMKMFSASSSTTLISAVARSNLARRRSLSKVASPMT